MMPYCLEERQQRESQEEGYGSVALNPNCPLQNTQGTFQYHQRPYTNKARTGVEGVGGGLAKHPEDLGAENQQTLPWIW